MPTISSRRAAISSALKPAEVMLGTAVASSGEGVLAGTLPGDSSVNIQGSDIETVDILKYLGVHLNKKPHAQDKRLNRREVLVQSVGFLS